MGENKKVETVLNGRKTTQKYNMAKKKLGKL